MSSEQKSSSLEKTNLVVTILAAALSLAASVYGFFAYENAKRVEEAIQARQATELNALELGRKSAFNVQSEISLNAQPLGDIRTAGKRQFLVEWNVALSNQGNRTVDITGLTLWLYKTDLPNARQFPVEFNPPWRKSPIQWTFVLDQRYPKTEGGADPDASAATGPMGPADRRYGEINVVVEGLPDTWIYGRAEVLLREFTEPHVEGDSDKIVEWAYRQLVERSANPKSR